MVVIYLVEQASIISSFYETRWDFPKANVIPGTSNSQGRGGGLARLEVAATYKIVEHLMWKEVFKKIPI